MILLTILSESATAVASTSPAWVEYLHSPFVRGMLVALLTQAVKAIPAIPITQGPAVAAVAAVLSVVVSVVSAIASGDLSGFDVDSGLTVIEEAVKTIAAAFGTAEAVKHGKVALAPREKTPETPVEPAVTWHA